MSDLAAVVKELRALKEKASRAPWKANGLVIDGPCTPHARVAAMVVTSPGFRPRSEADATLIVALVNHADLLLKAAEAVLDIASADANNPLTERDMLRIARAALAPDEGRTGE